jgi:hypothetical protein
MKRVPIILLGLLLVAFAAGLLHLLNLRFARGNIYPPASTFRTDPLGARAFHDALARVTTVHRHLQPLAVLGDGRRTTLFILGADGSDLRLPVADFKHLETFVADGGRLVLALRPDASLSSRFERWLDDFEEAEEARPRRRARTGPRTNAPASRKARQPISRDNSELHEPVRTTLQAEWQFTLETPSSQEPDQELPELTVLRRATNPLPAELAWHSPHHFQTTNAAWRVLYAAAPDRAVAIERRVGRGTVVLLTDSWHFSNEALREDRQPAWLAWLLGPQRRVIFDETHHGISEDPGIAALARRYRLHGVFAALLVLAALFIWRNSTSFPPVETPPARAAAEAAVQGREAAAGFVSLLRRNLPVASLAQTCFAAWRQSCARATPPARLQAVDDAFAAGSAQSTSGQAVTALYRRLSQILNRKDFKA